MLFEARPFHLVADIEDQVCNFSSLVLVQRQFFPRSFPFSSIIFLRRAGPIISSYCAGACYCYSSVLILVFSCHSIQLYKPRTSFSSSHVCNLLSNGGLRRPIAQQLYLSCRKNGSSWMCFCCVSDDSSLVIYAIWGTKHHSFQSATSDTDSTRLLKMLSPSPIFELGNAKLSMNYYYRRPHRRK